MSNRRLAISFILTLIAITAIIIPNAIALAQSGQAQIKNKAPTIESVTITTDDDLVTAGVQVNPTPNSTKSVSVEIQTRDVNGFNDIDSVSVVVYKPDGLTVHVASGSATFSSGTGANGDWTYSFNMNYYDTAAIGTSTYKVVATATDASAGTGDNSATPAEFNFTEYIALSLNTALIDFGSLDVGSTSAPVEVVGTNAGNITMDISVSGTTLVNTDPAKTDSIAITQIDYDLVNTFTNNLSLSTTSQTVSNYDLAPGVSATKPIYFQLNVPGILQTGIYEGSIDILGAASS